MADANQIHVTDVAPFHPISARWKPKEARRRPLVLCIDDNSSEARRICEPLEQRNFDVLAAADGRAGWSLLVDAVPDLILSEVHLPFFSGFDLLQARKELDYAYGEIPFIFLTRSDCHADNLKGRRLGADDYLTKPIDFSLLVEIMNTRLRRSARKSDRSRTYSLNPRETTALLWAARGKTSEEIAIIMAITERTVNFHINNARTKLGVATRIQAAVKAALEGIIEP